MVNRVGILRAERKAARQTPWQRDEIARRLHWPPSKLQRIENGTVAPSADDIAALSQFFGVAPSRLGLKPRKAGKVAS